MTDLDRELALRGPQLRRAEASVASAEAALERAALDLERTVIRAPFDAVVAEAQADVGDQATAGKVLARLVATDAYWVRASVRTDELQWLTFPGPDAPEPAECLVRTPSGGEYLGRLARLAPELEMSGRMAQVLITVPDPLMLESERGLHGSLLLGEFVRVQITGRAMTNVTRIARTALRDGSSVWLLDRENRLRIVPVRTVWGTPSEVFVESRFPEESRLIVSSLSAPVEGMSLSLENGARPTPGHGQPSESDRGKEVHR
jgi:multidrug efflux pump subunit AcrA (membrane-fusion protein)